ncbi:MAG: hypothetical protein EPN48_08510 [Microbacteriaceae bacterium]|nr:MAG: hypothetical protein EPN48_08510 [Microbacteriaceae bacterium]
MAESFFATLKAEFYYQVLLPMCVARLRIVPTQVGAWIKDRYNRRRRHASIGQVAPAIFGT